MFLDVVFNHTGEQAPWTENGRVMAKYYNFMGLCNTRVFRPTGDGRFYRNDTGTGNDVDFSGPAGRFTKRLTTDSLSLWYHTYGIDGFRFDLARILANDSDNAATWVADARDFAPAPCTPSPGTWGAPGSTSWTTTATTPTTTAGRSGSAGSATTSAISRNRRS